MAKVKFKRFLSDNDLENVNIEDGSFIVTKDGTSYIDYVDERVPFGGTSDDEMSDTSINSVKNKVIKSYVDSEIDNASDEISNLRSYSTTEVDTGKTWIDGKPIYRKVFTGTTATTIDVSSLNIDTGFVDMSHSYFYWSYRYTPVQVTTTSSQNWGTYMAGVYFNSTKTTITLERGTNISISEYIITIEYTKTTD